MKNDLNDGHYILPRNQIRAVLLRSWLCTFLAFVFLRLMLAEYWGEMNQFVIGWKRTHLLALIGIIGGLSGVMLFVYGTLTLLGRVGRYVRDLGFLMFTLFYLKVAGLEVVFAKSGAPPILSWALNGIVLLVVLVFFARRQKVIQALDNVCLALSPIMVIYVITLLFASPVRPSWTPEGALKRGHQPPAASHQKMKTKRIFVFIFDAMSYHRTFGGGLDEKEFPNLARAAKDSIVFDKTYSIANSTIEGIPGLVCGVVGKFKSSGGVSRLVVDGNMAPIHTLPSLFKDMHERGRKTGLYGCAIPFDTFFGQEIDLLELDRGLSDPSWSHVWRATLSHLKRHLRVRLGRFIPGPGVEPGRVAIDGSEVSSGPTLALKEKFVQMTIDEITSTGNISSFFVFHHMLPHAPYLYNRNGPLPEEKMVWAVQWNEDAYEGNLRYADTIIGRFLDALRSHEDYERTMFIITADHSVRSDPLIVPEESDNDRDYMELCHVPLLIHLAGQTERIDIMTPFSHAWLREILVDYVDGKIDNTEFVERCRGIGGDREVEFVIDRTKVF